MNRTTRSANAREAQPHFAVSPGRRSRLLRTLGLLCAVFAGSAIIDAANAATILTLDQLRRDPHLTPERFMTYFRDFQFRLGEKRQAPEVFLATKRGDCDDFAALADQILREKKYTTKLIAVFMDGQTHVVCYVKEIHGYLDYNCRAESCAIQTTNGKLEDVADKVAAYFRTGWRSVSEFTYQSDTPRYRQIVFR